MHVYIRVMLQRGATTLSQNTTALPKCPSKEAFAFVASQIPATLRCHIVSACAKKHSHAFVRSDCGSGRNRADAVMISSPYIEGKITLFDEDLTPAQKGPKHIDTCLPGGTRGGV